MSNLEGVRAAEQGQTRLTYAWWAALAFACSIVPGVVAAQSPAPPQPAGGVQAAGRDEPFAISDNSFLVEEAFNQEAGIFQNIFNAARTGGVWASTFTQEWPVASQAHQLSYTLAWAFDSDSAAMGDVLVNYRFQALSEGPGVPAFSPRVSLVVPTGDASVGSGAPGMQVNLPFSKQTGEVYWHWNAGMTVMPSVEFAGETRSLESPFLAGSGIFRVRRMLHAMVESVLSFDDRPTFSGSERERTVTLSPGVRGGWNLGDRQLVLGFAVPVTWSGGETDRAAFFYCSYELPFAR